MFEEVPNVMYYGGHEFELGSDMSMSSQDWKETPKPGNVTIQKGGSTVFYVHGRALSLGESIEFVENTEPPKKNLQRPT